MPRDIKQFKPQVDSRHQQGYLNPKSCKKLFEHLAHQPIIFRSSWEKRYAYWCENNPHVKRWGSECITIPYILYDGSSHIYNPDFVVEMDDGTTWVIEIKPYNQCSRPLTENGWLWDAYTKNMCKWKAAKKFCEDRGLKFKVLTEKTISKL